MPVANDADNAELCICPTCPTHDDCMKDNDELLFCARGKTRCEPSSQGCVCGECPVWSRNSLGSYYFCLMGAAV